MTIFLRLLDVAVDDKPNALRQVVRDLVATGGQERVPLEVFERDPSAFTSVPGSPFAYWVSDPMRVLFQRFAPFETEGRFVKQGLASADDFRFLRLWWEVGEGTIGPQWFGFAKGGAFSKFYADVYLCVNWRSGGAEIKNNLNEQGAVRSNVWMLRDTASNCFGRAGLTWPRRTNGLSFRLMPTGCIFGDKGPAAFIKGNDSSTLLALAAIVNSTPFGYLIAVQLARTELAQSYEVGLIQQTPVPKVSPADVKVLSKLARRSWSLKRTLDTTNETSHAFVLPPGVIRHEAVASTEQAGPFDRSAAERELVETQREIDEQMFALYGISAEDRMVIEKASKRGTISKDDDRAEGDEEGDGTDESDEAPIGGSVLPVYSWLVGVAFGRFDQRLTSGDRAIPPEPEPFDPLPSRSPGMCPEGEPRNLIPPEVLVDDPGHAHDLGTRVGEVAANAGWPAPDDLRLWFAREFFPLHIKMYSKSRRKAPIYWQLATPSASYSVWLYLHAFTKDTLYKVQNDYVAPKLAHEERRLECTASPGT